MDRQAAALPLDEQRELMSRIARRVELGAPAGSAPVSLRGAWSSRVHADFDLDKELHSIRGDWKHTLGDAQQ